MARKIEKKVISDDLLFGDDFDENKLAKMEEELIRTPISDDLEKGKTKKRAAAAADEALEGAGPDADVDRELPTQPPSADDAPDTSAKQQAAVARMVRSKKLLLLTFASVLVLITAGLLSFYWFILRPESLASHQTVRHPIVVPSHKHVSSFLLLVSNLEKKKDLLKVEVEFDFWSTHAYEAFKSKQVLFNDVIYKFLRDQEPPDNSFEAWEKILAKDLFENLTRNYPETRLNAVQMKYFQRL